MIYLYAITDQPDTSLATVPGLEDASLLGLSYGDIAAVVSPVTTTQVPATEDNLWRHEAIVEGLAPDRAVLPVRFGTVLADEAAMETVLQAHYADLVASLDRVRGRVELGLRALWDEESGQSVAADGRLAEGGMEEKSAKDGRSYLQARVEEERRRRAQQRHAEARAAEVHHPLARLAVESLWRVLITPRTLLKAAYLIERNGVTAFLREVETLRASHPTLRFLCTGPWPAYSFVTTAVPGTAVDQRPQV